MNCPDCGTQMYGLEYAYPHPDRYDGVSEWGCPKCQLRIGRWTGKRLAAGESEPPHGITRETPQKPSPSGSENGTL